MSKKNRNVLVIEDDDNLRSTVRQVLESEGYSVFSATHGKDGLEMLQEIDQPSLILLDIQMPEMDGYEFLAEKNSDPTLAPIPVVVVGATADASRLKGVVDVVKKPFEIETLLIVVNSTLNRN